MAEIPRGPTTKEKLASIVHGFDEFDTEMKRGTRQRREKDEFRITELKTEMSRLDSDLTVEIKRRTEMNKSTQIWFEDQLSNLNVKFHETLEKRKEETYHRLERLNERISNMDMYFEDEKAKILKYIDDRGEELARLLYKFKEEFDEDRALRLDREAVIVKQLTDHEQEVNERFENQIESREARYSAVREILEDNVRLRDKTEARFQAFFDKELNRLKNDFRSEAEIREKEDDEIIEALNRYTLKLQTSLKVVNSTDM
uniref:SF-assemblin n=1 Tax=Spumella elongata TaxID=89044 RepID=A0A7S3M234_9STRA